MPLLLVDHFDGLQVPVSELTVDVRQLLCGEVVELLDDIVELVAKNRGAGDLLVRRAAFVLRNVAIEVARVLA